MGIPAGSPSARAMSIAAPLVGTKAREGSGYCALSLRHWLGWDSIGDAWDWPKNLPGKGYYPVGGPALAGDIICLPRHVGLAGDNGKYISNWNGTIQWRDIPSNARLFRWRG